METRFLFKTLMQSPPEPLRRVMDKLDASDDIGRWEELHLDLSRELARAMLEERLRSVPEPAETPCPRCATSTPESDSSEAGASPP